MDAHSKPTAQSLIYRRRAAELAHAADGAGEGERQIDMIKQALRWIELAENDEFLVAHRDGANDN